MSHYSVHHPAEYHLGSYTSAAAMEPSLFSIDVTPSTNTNPPQHPASLISYPGNLAAANTFSLDAQGHMGPAFLQLPLPTTPNEDPFFSQPPSR